MRLIDADILKGSMSKRMIEKRDLNASFYEVINEQPTVEAVEVVRCKECKHYGTSLKGIPTQGYCKLTEWQTRHDNDYCSMGEKTDGRR